MKPIIFVLLIYYSFCQIYELQKFGTIKTTSYNGIVYLNTEDFEIDDIIHIQFNAINGNMNSIIYYQFYHIIPNSTFYPSKSMDASNHVTSTSNINGISTKTEEYYYDIKKEDEKYLIITFSGFNSKQNGAYLEIKNAKINWASSLGIILLSVIGLIIIIIIIVYCIRINRKKKNNIDYEVKPPSNSDPSLIPPQYNQPSQANTGYDSTTVNNYPQQQNIYNGPPQAPINY